MKKDLPLSVEGKEKELRKMKEVSRRIQEREVPTQFHHVEKGDNIEEVNNDLKKKETYASVLKKGTKIVE